MDKALVSGAKDCGFESRRGYLLRFLFIARCFTIHNRSPVDSAIGVVASIVASQAIDPGSIPGWRTDPLFLITSFVLRDAQKIFQVTRGWLQIL